MKYTNKKTALLLMALLFSIPTLAATVNVAKWGADNATCGKSSDPCLSIQQGLDNAGVRGKIIVYPGVYTENININDEGQKLESVAGRYATIIEAAVTSDHVVDILAAKVQVGKKGKGFTLTGATDNFVAGIWINNSSHINSKIESNRAMDNYYGFLLRGDKIQARNNIVQDNSNIGFSCFFCNKALLQDNTASNNGSFGFFFEGSDAVSFKGNRAHANTSGVFFNSNSEFAKVSDNVSDNNSSIGFRFADMDGAQIKGNISAQNGNDGFELTQGLATKAPKISSNLAVDNTNEGFDLYTTDSAKLDGNSAIQSTSTGIYVNSGTIASFKNNNSYDTDGGVGIYNDSGNLITRSTHFFGSVTSSGAPDGAVDADAHDALGGSNHAGTNSTKENKFKAKKAAAL